MGAFDGCVKSNGDADYFCESLSVPVSAQVQSLVEMRFS